MAADTLKSASITNLDSSPIVENTSGSQGAMYVARNTADNVTPTAAGLVAVGSKYTVVRVARDVFLQHINLFADLPLDSNGTPLLAVDVGAFYSDSAFDGTLVANQGVAISDNAFADAYLLKAQTAVFAVEAGKWTAAQRQQPLWQALGISKDPGGFIDIVILVETAAATAQSAALVVEVVTATN